MTAAAPVIAVVQTRFELEQLLTLARALGPPRIVGAGPESILEIGVWDGGTLREWLNIATRTVVAVDDEMRYPDLWHKWSEGRDADLHLLKGVSQAAGIVEQAAALGPYDLVFIDGDHTPTGVRRDWELYSPLVRPGGMVAFHDIVERPGYGVSGLWAEIKAAPGARWVEIVETSDGYGGIGAVWL